MLILNLESGTPFQMGRGKNWRVVHPEMGAEQITLNHGLHAPAQEFTQHIHDASEDAIVVLEGGGSIRQGSVYTPISACETIFVPAGEVHGTVNTTDKPARLISFQCPPDMALYRGERDHKEGQSPMPRSDHRSNVQVIDMARGGPVFGVPGDWRGVVSREKGSRYLGLDYAELSAGDEFAHQTRSTESIYVLLSGQAAVSANGDDHMLSTHDVVFLSPGDSLSLRQAGTETLKLVLCWALES